MTFQSALGIVTAAVIIYGFFWALFTIAMILDDLGRGLKGLWWDKSRQIPPRIKNIRDSKKKGSKNWMQEKKMSFSPASSEESAR